MGLKSFAVNSVVALSFLVSHQLQQANVVRLPIIVTNSSNQLVTDLKREELHIVDNKTELRIVGLERSDERIKYVIALDTSGSFRSVLPYAIGASGNLIQQNRPQDETALVSFVSSDRIALQQTFTSDQSQLFRSFQRLKIMGGQSAVIDGAYFAVQTLALDRPKSGREAVVLVSDGEDRNSTHSYENLAELLRQTGVQVFVIGMIEELDKQGGFVKSSPRDKAKKLLTNIADDSHGRVFFPKNRDELLQAALEISKTLRSQYYVTFEAPPSKPGKHQVEINLNRAGEKLKLASSSSYYVETSPSSTTKP